MREVEELANTPVRILRLIGIDREIDVLVNETRLG